MKKILLLVIVFHSVQAFAFDTWWHAECTRKAMVANGFSADARLATQVSNYLTDFMAVMNMGNEKLAEAGIERLRLRSDHSYDFMHFDAIFTTEDIEKNWALVFANTVSTLKKYADGSLTEPGFRQIILFNIVGASLHIVQDFYSHSNWVNLYSSQGRSPIPVWYDVPLTERAAMKLYTGIYQKPYNGHTSHDDLHKDNSARPFNKEAVETAERASTDWVKRIMEATPEVNWAGLKSYNIQSDRIMKNFLSKLDATFLTSSSIAAGKFDGDNSVKHVFSEDSKKERFQAVQILEATIGEYLANSVQASNKYRLFTPYWAGFMGYNIIHDMACGLKLNKEKYAGPSGQCKTAAEEEQTADPKQKNSPVAGKPAGTSSKPQKGNTPASSGDKNNNPAKGNNNNTNSGSNPASTPGKTPTPPPPSKNPAPVNSGGIKKDTLQQKKPG
jgi:uncharacterized membrane protein YwzB